MRAKLLALCCCLLLCTSCHYIPAGIDDLLAAPQLNTRQAEIDLALRATVDIDAIQYKYPLGGAYRSPFVFYDLDGDGFDEAIVFYAYLSDSTAVRAKVLQQTQPGVWVSAYDISGPGSEVEFVQFANFMPGGSAMVIGWQTARRNSSTLGVYSFGGGVFHPEIQEPYARYLILSGAPDGMDRLALVSEIPGTGDYSLSLYRNIGARLALSGSYNLQDNVGRILQLRSGRFWDGGTALYIDQFRLDSLYATEVVRMTWTGLAPAVDSEDFDGVYVITFRERELLSRDLDGDGTVEIPYVSALPGYETGEDPPLVEYMQLDENNGYQIVYRAVTNEAAGYYVFYPDRWLEQVTLVRQPENNEWRFSKIDPDTGQPSVDLLRIRRYATGDYVDQFAGQSFLVGQKGPYEYYAQVAGLPGEPLAISEEEARELFRLL